MVRTSAYFGRRASRFFEQTGAASGEAATAPAEAATASAEAATAPASDAAEPPVPDVPMEDGARCPRCAAGVCRVRDGRYGPFLGCSAFPSCRYTHPVAGGTEREPSAKRPRRSPRIRVRFEMETASTVRCWEPAKPGAPQSALDGQIRAGFPLAAARADWAPAFARTSLSTLHGLDEYESVLQALRSGTGGGESGGGGEGGGGGDDDGGRLLSRPRFFCFSRG